LLEFLIEITDNLNMEKQTENAKMKDDKYAHAAVKIFLSRGKEQEYAPKRTSQMLLRMGRACGEMAVVESAKNLLELGY
jgi:hypothetical protein